MLGRVRVQLRVAGDDPETVRSLREWLRQEPDVRQHGDIQWGTTDSPEHMGVLIDVVTVLLSSGFSAAQLAFAIVQWRASRHPAPVVTISRHMGDGTTVRVETSDAEVLARAVRELEAP
jgi:hypothetical protein